MATVVFLSCTKSKLDKRAPAQELYSPSPTFKKTLDYGNQIKPDKMFILSAKHHLVPLEKELDPYDLTLKEMKKDEKDAWGEEVMKQMKEKGINVEKDKMIFLVGAEYMKPITKLLPDNAQVEVPMQGLRMGERMKWLNSKIKKVTEVIKRIKTLVYESFKRKTRRVN